MMLDCRAKNEVKRPCHSGDIPVKRIKQSDWQKGFWAKNSGTRDCLK